MENFDHVVGDFLSIIEKTPLPSDKLKYIGMLYDFLCDNLELVKARPDLLKPAVLCLRKFIYTDRWKEGKSYLKRLCPRMKISRGFDWTDYEIKILSGPDSTCHVPNYFDCREGIKLTLPCTFHCQAKE